MEVHTVEKAEFKDFLGFIRKLYRGDRNYVCTQGFLIEPFLYGTSRFVRRCAVRPVAVGDNGATLAQCLFIHDPNLPALQVGFFEALPNASEAVALLLNEAKAHARGLGLNQSSSA